MPLVPTRLLAACATALAAAAFVPATAFALPDGFEEVTLASGLQQPTAVAFAPASDGRMFIAEQRGVVKVRMPDGTMTQLLDWHDKVNAYGDRGLVGIATDADFGDNGYLYLLFVADTDAVDDDGPHSSRLVRLTITADNEINGQKNLVGGASDQGACAEPDGSHATAADAALDCIPAWATTHAIGTIASDPRDGTLWFGSGDAQSVEFNTYNRPKRLLTFNEETFVGKVMHIDREGRGLANHPFCPGVTDLDRVCTKISAKGFRNPFRFTVPTQDGAPVVVGDVGNEAREELNLLRPGGNYGWPCWEGVDVRPRYYNGYSLCSGYVDTSTTPDTPRNIDLPAFAYGHPTVFGSPQGAIQAGPVYDGSSYPSAYRGGVFFGDYALGFIRWFPAGPTPGTFAISPTAIMSPDDPNSSVPFDQRGAFTQLTSAPNGDVVVVDFLTGEDYSGPGRVVRYAHADGNRGPAADAAIADEEVAPGGVAQLDATGSRDPDLDPLTFAWDFDGDGTVDSTDPAPDWTTPATPGVYSARVTVSDGRGKSDAATVKVLVGVHRPEVTITAPEADSLYDGGQQITFSGEATDADEPGGLPAASLRWEIRLLHGRHYHPLVDIAGQASGAFTAWQDHGLDSSYRIRLVATDASGLEASATVHIRPRPATVRVESEPAGAPIEVDDQTYVASRDVPAAVGMLTQLRAAEDFTRDGRTYRFSRWEDGTTSRQRAYEVRRGGGTIRAVYATDPVAEPPPPSSGPADPGGTAAGDPPPASGGSGGAGGASGTPADPGSTPRAGAARLRVASPWPGRRRTARIVTGTLTGVAQTPTVQVALSRSAGSRCRWWSAGSRRFGRPAACRAPVWTTAKVRRGAAAGAWRFDAALRAAVARGRGTIRARAIVRGRTVAQVTVRVTVAR